MKTLSRIPAPPARSDLLARGSVDLNAGFVLSDADPAVMPILANIASALAPFDVTVTAAQRVHRYLVRLRPDPGQCGRSRCGRSQFACGVRTPTAPCSRAIPLPSSIPDTTSLDFTAAFVTSTIEAERHAGLHVGEEDNPVRIFALDGDVASPETNSFSSQPLTVDVTAETEVYAGRDVVNLALLGENNNATDITSVVAGQDVIYTTQPPPPSTVATITGALEGWTQVVPPAIEIGGPGNLLVESGRNVDLGISTGIQSFGNLLNPNLPSVGASVTIETGLGSSLAQPEYGNFFTQFGNPDSSNQYAEPPAALRQ